MVDKAKEKQVESLTIYEKLHVIQLEIKSPKDQKAKNYSYRSAEDIIAALKPFLKEYQLLLMIDDDLQLIGERYYVKSTATLRNVGNEESVSASAFAREQENLTIMSQGQLSGATSSFARKYALGALLGVDDTADLDKQIDDSRNNPPVTKKVIVNATQAEALRVLADKKGADIEIMEEYYGMKVEKMDIATYTHAVNSLEKRADKEQTLKKELEDIEYKEKMGYSDQEG